MKFFPREDKDPRLRLTTLSSKCYTCYFKKVIAQNIYVYVFVVSKTFSDVEDRFGLSFRQNTER